MPCFTRPHRAALPVREYCPFLLGVSQPTKWACFPWNPIPLLQWLLRASDCERPPKGKSGLFSQQRVNLRNLILNVPQKGLDKCLFEGQQLMDVFYQAPGRNQASGDFPKLLRFRSRNQCLLPSVLRHCPFSSSHYHLSPNGP